VVRVVRVCIVSLGWNNGVSSRGARFASYVVQWTLAKRRGKAAAALLDEFGKSGLDALLSPPGEAAALELLAARCESAEAARKLRAVPLAEEAQAEAARACGQCHFACVALSAACGEFRLLLKEWVASADEYEKREKARRGLAAKRDAAQVISAQSRCKFGAISP